MTAVTYNFTLEQGVPLSKTVLLKNSDNSIKDLTGFTALMHLRQYPSSEVVLLELSSANSKININTATGAVTMIFSLEDTALLNYQTCSYDLFMLNGSSTFRALAGKITVQPRVTRSA